MIRGFLRKRWVRSLGGYGIVGVVGWVAFLPFTNLVYWAFGTSILVVNAANFGGLALGYVLKWWLGVRLKVIAY